MPSLEEILLRIQPSVVGWLGDDNPLSRYDAAVRAIPGLRAYFSEAVTGAGEWYSQSGAVVLARSGATYKTDTLGFGYWDLGAGISDYLSATDSSLWDLLGNEAWVDSGNKGFSICGWIFIDTYGTPGKFRGVVSHYDNTAAGSNFVIVTYETTQSIRLGTYSGGSAYDIDLAVALSTGAWHYFSAIFKPSTHVRIRGDASISQLTTSIPSSLNNSAAPFRVGATTGLDTIDGRIARLAVFGQRISDDADENLYQLFRQVHGG